MTDHSGYTLDLSPAIQDVDREAWLSLTHGESDVFMHPRLLAAVETSMAADARCWYALFRDRRRQPVAAAAISAAVIDSSVLAVGIGAKIAKVVARVMPKLTRMKILFLGMPFSAGQSHVRFAPDADREAIVGLLDGLLMRLAKESKSEIIVAKEFQDEELGWASQLERFGYRHADSLPMNYMPVEFQSFDHYLQSLKEKKRWELRRTRKRFHEAGLTRIVCRGEEAAARFDDRAHKLYENVLFKSESRSEYLPAEFFREFARQLPENVEIIYFYEGEQLVAFGCCLFADGIFIPMYAGLDYERNREYDLYLNMLYDSVDRGLQTAPRNLWVGANADEIKHRKLGTYQEPRHLFVKGGWWLARLALRVAFNMFFPAHSLQYPKADGSETAVSSDAA